MHCNTGGEAALLLSSVCEERKQNSLLHASSSWARCRCHTAWSINVKVKGLLPSTAVSTADDAQHATLVGRLQNSHSLRARICQQCYKRDMRRC
jgi:hypothetical protein